VGCGDNKDGLPREKRWSSSDNEGLLVQYSSGVLVGKVWPKGDWRRGVRSKESWGLEVLIYCKMSRRWSRRGSRDDKLICNNPCIAERSTAETY
jgi:hypothetical protein